MRSNFGGGFFHALLGTVLWTNFALREQGGGGFFHAPTGKGKCCQCIHPEHAKTRNEFDEDGDHEDDEDEDDKDEDENHEDDEDEDENQT